MTRQKYLTKQLLTTGVAVTATLVLNAPVLADPDTIDMVAGPQCDVVFAVNDRNLNDSQIVFMGGDGTGVTPLGAEYPDYDLEAMDIDANNVLYVASGDDSVLPGHLFKVNKATAELGLIGKLCVDEADGISFNLVDNTLWGWGQDQGLFHVLRGANGELDLSTCEIVLSVAVGAPDGNSYNDEIEDLTWDNTGEILYGVGNVFDGDHDANNDDGKARAVVAFNPATNEISQVCRTVMEPVDDEIEGIEMQPDGTIMFTYHNRNKVSIYGYINPNTCEMWEGVSVDNPTPFNDIEALACCVDQGGTLPWTYQKDYVGDATGSSSLEIYGMAVKIDNGVMTVAMNTNMGPGASQAYFINSAVDQHISFSDLVLDFSGKKYAAKFAEANNSGVTERGLYEAITLKDVTQENRGYVSFQSYASHLNNSAEHMLLTGMGVDAISTTPTIMGALTLKSDYFSWTASRSAPMSIKIGTRVVDDGFTMLSEAQLAGMGLDFKGAGITVDKKNSRGQVIGVNGSYTFGFSFQMTEEMDGDFLAYFFTECLNDGMAIRVSRKSC